MPRQFYVGLPNETQRAGILRVLLKDQPHSADIAMLARRTDGFSGADLRELCSLAAMGPIREVTAARRQQPQDEVTGSDDDGAGTTAEEGSRPRRVPPQLRPLTDEDFELALRRCVPTLRASKRYREAQARDDAASGASGTSAPLPMDAMAPFTAAFLQALAAMRKAT